jgi:hypothetical protein
MLSLWLEMREANLRKNIHDHPPHQHKLSLENEDEGLQAVDCPNHHQGQNRNGGLSTRDDHDEIHKLRNVNRRDRVE